MTNPNLVGILMKSSIIPTMRNITIEMTFEISENINAAMLYEHLYDAAMDYADAILILETSYDCTEEEREEADRLMETVTV